MNQASKWLAALVLAAGLGGLPGCGHGGGATAQERPDPGAGLELVHVDHLGPEHNPEIWEVLRGLYVSGPPRAPRREVFSPGRSGPFGHLNPDGGLLVQDASAFLADLDAVEQAARAWGVVRIDACVPAAGLATPAGQEALRRGYLDQGPVYNLDGRHLVRTLPAGAAAAGEAPKGWRSAEEDIQHRRAAPAYAYAALPEDLKPHVDRQLAELHGHLATFLRRPAPGSPVLGGIVFRDLPGHSYGHGLYVAEFWVSPEVRHRGRGRQLMDTVVRWARGHGVRAVSLWTHQGLAYPFYEKYGFRRTVTVPGQVVCEGGARFDLYEYVLEEGQFSAALDRSRR